MPETSSPDGCRLHYDRTGAGPPVVLIPGLGGDGRFWTGVARHLEARFEVIAVDHRGAGRSERPSSPYSIGQIAADVLSVLDAAGWHEAHLVGHSTGGAVVQTLALDAPDRVRSIVISGSWDRPDARFRTLFAARAALLDHGQTEVYQALTHVFGYHPAWIETHEADLAAAVRSAPMTLQPLDVAAARVRMLLDFDRSAELGRIRHPALVVGALDDVLIPIQHARRLSALIPQAGSVELTGGHFHPRTDPAPFAERLIAFLTTLPPAGRTEPGAAP